MNRYAVNVRAIDARHPAATPFDSTAETTAFDKSAALVKVFDALTDQGYRVLSMEAPEYVGSV